MKPYTGSNKVNIGNGIGLYIHHIGTTNDTANLYCPKFSKTIIL